jgi:hypothetical protein
MLNLNFDAATERDINTLAQLEGMSVEQVLTEAFKLYCEAEKRENRELNEVADGRLRDGQGFIRVSLVDL